MQPLAGNSGGELRRRGKSEIKSLYKQFILEASKLYTDALEHDTTEITKLVDIYATLNRMRVLSSPKWSPRQITHCE